MPERVPVEKELGRALMFNGRTMTNGAVVRPAVESCRRVSRRRRGCGCRRGRRWRCRTWRGRTQTRARAWSYTGSGFTIHARDGARCATFPPTPTPLRRRSRIWRRRPSRVFCPALAGWDRFTALRRSSARKSALPFGSSASTRPSAAGARRTGSISSLSSHCSIQDEDSPQRTPRAQSGER